MCGSVEDIPGVIKSTGHVMFVHFYSNLFQGWNDRGYELKIIPGTNHRIMQIHIKIVRSPINHVLFSFSIVSKCICENENGGGIRGHWLCEDDGLFVPSDGCYKDEWCIGPHITNNATFVHESLCTNGRY